MSELASRLSRSGQLITITRLRPSGYYEVTKLGTWQYDRRLFDTGREAWAYYRNNKIN